jgi:integrase
MATIRKIIGKTGKASYQVLFYLGRKRKTLSLGSSYAPKQVERIRLTVEEIADAIETGGKVGKSTAGFIADMTDDLKARFIACGLLEESEEVTLAELFKRYLAAPSERKESTERTYITVKKRFFAFFPADGAPGALTRQDGEAWKKWLKKQNYADATICGCIQRTATLFNWAVEQGYLEANPFKGVKRGSFENPNRMFYVPMDWYYKLLDACPSQTWKTLIALCRIGGLRNPSETLRLTWQDVDFGNGSILVHSPKTEHHAGKDTRLIPMFPELREQLELQWELAEVGGSPYVIAEHRDTCANMRTQFRRIIFRAGLPEWERTFQNLRESRANEIWSEYPRHVAAAWMGHSERIAFKHYLQVTDEQFQKAIGGNDKTAGAVETAGGAKHPRPSLENHRVLVVQ